MRTNTFLLLMGMLIAQPGAGTSESAGIESSEEKPLRQEVSLGTPVVTHTLWSSVVTRHSEDNRPLLVTGTWCAGGGAPVLIFDPAKNAVDSVPVDTLGTYGVTPGPNGWIYIGTVSDATLYRYHLDRKVLEIIGRPASSETWLYNLLVLGERYVLGGTYSGGRLAGYDLHEKRLVDFGPMHPPERYVCATAPGPKETVYCGIGSHAGLIHFDPATGEKENILPERYAENSFVYRLHRDGRYLYASVIFDNRILVFDTHTDRLVRDFGKESSMIGGDGAVWVGAEGVTGRWNAEKAAWREKRTLPAHTREVTAEGLAFTYDGESFAAVEMGSGKERGRAKLEPDGNGQKIFTLHTGPDGSVYGSSYNLHHIFRVDPKSGVAADLGNPVPSQGGEVYAFANDGPRMYMASYTYARLSVYDTEKPWQPGTNPRPLGELGDEQYRTPGLVFGPDKKLYVGSTPAYGKVGGALSIYDPVTGGIEVFRHLIPNQSVVSVAADSRRNWILGGSSIQVGLGGDPVEKDAHLFAWDCAQKKLIADFVPVPGQGAIDHVSLLPDGTVLAACGATLVHADVAAEKVLRSEPWPGGGITAIVAHAEGIYINSGGGLFIFDLERWQASKFAPGGSFLALDNAGYAYYARGPELYRVPSDPLR